jgi:hypothetical protein
LKIGTRKEVMRLAKEKGKHFVGPKSLCRCSHTGDGEGSQHGNENFNFGSGRCLVNGCICERFTWAKWTKKFENFLENHKTK